ncbi:PPR domain-containing protein/PPR_1 domain-containing protein/PPR_2 domain-containing protein [Cephalotus follicularis]|uniref:PPR domain-containing protein/PPR_1 domain-containing protein/PPR_2 domain-containing protein n=1 Tax=Cephalotus follicularis TaxID=3775 RepID=A0A1Q3AXJ7_CEPFO|nr:PPR domain-containing protein/PPR_1 domain-containing protein/PPR_2 domain-containing protein [Cephalotus follicularis]
MQIHAHLLTTGLLFSSYNIHSKLILSYTNGLNKNNLKTLTNFFKSINLKNPLPFNVLISEFCRNGFHFFALKTFSFMHFNGVPLDTYALCSSLLSSSLTKDVKLGNRIHSHVVKSGWLSSVFVGSALIDVYAKSQFISDAEMVFDEMPVKNTVCANALLSAYGEAKLWIEGLELFRKMPVLNLEYDHFTLSAMLRAFAGLSAIELGRQVHAHSIRKVHDVGNDVILQSSLIEMYGKCGLAGKALQVFSLTGRGQRGERKRDVVLWTSMLGVYGRNGQFEEVIELFKVMLMEGIIPDGVAFVTVISACGHTGQVQLGIDYFESMTRDCKLDPQPAHYSCLVDLLCRAGEVDKAWKLVNEMIHGGHGCGSVSMWGTLLSACKDHANVELANLAAKKALELDPQNIGIYVMLRNLYAKLGMWEEIERLRELIKGRELKKDVGCSWIQITN